MTRLSFFRRRLPLAAIAICMLAGAYSKAQASTVTYVFSQAGYSDSAGNTGSLSGTFTATPEANGVVQSADVSSFSALFQETVNGLPNSFFFNLANDLSYDPNTPGSLTFSAGSTQSGLVACTGSIDVNAICEGLTGPNGPRIDAFGFFEDLPNFGTSLSRQGSITTVTSGPTSAAPEPGTSALLATGAALLFVGRFRRRLSAKASAAHSRC